MSDFYLWFLFASSLFHLTRLRLVARREQGQGSIHHAALHRAMFAVYALVVLLGLFDYLRHGRSTSWPWTAGGCGLYLLGACLRESAVRALGPMMSVHVKVYPDHRLVRNGPYARIRHPMLVAVWLELVGLSLAAQSVPALAATVVCMTPMVIVRMRAEDQILSEILGEEHALYRHQVAAVWPRWRRPKSGADRRNPQCNQHPKETL